MKDLAIVIPAYKDIYFEKTLDSLAAQTNKKFTVYIGDDYSPFDLKTLADKYQDKLDIHYTRFPDNIGSKNLVHQWNRCIQLTKTEKWLWLFSDDDVMDNDCVDNFYSTIEKKAGRFDVFRFNTVTIDANGDITRYNETGPEEESSEQMAYHLLKTERGNSMPDHIFTREVYDLCGGLVFTEYAQGADWASSILFSKGKGICIIPGSKVYWRYSGTNISSIASGQRNDMMQGFLQFVTWAAKHFEYLKTTQSGITYEMMMDAIKTNLTTVVINHYKGFELNNSVKLFNAYHKILNLSSYNALKELLVIKENTDPAFNKLHRLGTKFKNIINRTGLSVKHN